jgi:hypothetical protein
MWRRSDFSHIAPETCDIVSFVYQKSLVTKAEKSANIRVARMTERILLLSIV